ncbi:hypothetical protein RCOM_0810280 [Ricinus communis]|uniref:Uncharacterized protein n=1 Tax=Ricinus communis TaxID=3988 RepID=B9RY54_RICCO|nr:hypothetical protein RCOM_0810280 [Ricinus communis]
MRDTAAAKRRWDLLAWVKGSSWILISKVDNRYDIGTLTTFMMGGWWSGAPTLAYDKYVKNMKGNDSESGVNVKGREWKRRGK